MEVKRVGADACTGTVRWAAPQPFRPLSCRPGSESQAIHRSRVHSERGQRWKAQRQCRGGSAEVMRRPESRVRLSLLKLSFLARGVSPSPSISTRSLLALGSFRHWVSHQHSVSLWEDPSLRDTNCLVEGQLEEKTTHQMPSPWALSWITQLEGNARVFIYLVLHGGGLYLSHCPQLIQLRLSPNLFTAALSISVSISIHLAPQGGRVGHGMQLHRQLPELLRLAPAKDKTSRTFADADVRASRLLTKRCCRPHNHGAGTIAFLSKSSLQYFPSVFPPFSALS